MQKFKDGTKFNKLFKIFYSYNIGTPQTSYSSTTLSTNIGLYKAITELLIHMEDKLDSVINLGNELDSMDENAAQQSKKAFLEHFPSSKIDCLLKQPDSNVPRKWLFKELTNAKYLYYKITDKKNNAYHNHKYYYSIIYCQGHKIYTNKLITFENDKRTSKSLMKSKKKSPLANILIKQYKSDLNIAKNILASYGYSKNSRFEIVPNPNVRNTTMPRIMTINHNLFYYDPKKVNKKYIIFDNIPNLNNSDIGREVTVISANNQGIYEY